MRVCRETSFERSSLLERPLDNINLYMLILISVCHAALCVSVCLSASVSECL